MGNETRQRSSFIIFDHEVITETEFVLPGNRRVCIWKPIKLWENDL